MGNRLIFLGKPGDGFGWGVCNANLFNALKPLCDVELCTDEERNRFDDPVFCPVTDGGLRPPRPIKCPRLIGYGFWEMPLTDAAQFNSNKYHHIFAGSSWCSARVKSAGQCENVSPLVQGVDFERFTPQPWNERKGFRVFSGGKYEFRKAQDIVLAAMRIFMSQRTDAALIAAWHNPWPETMQSMNDSPLIDVEDPFKDLPKDRVFLIPPTPNEKMPAIYQQTDVGIFPNRCEGGTNLVMMEYMASGRPVIALAETGQADVLRGEGPLFLTSGSLDNAGWFHCDVSDVLVQLETAYQKRNELPNRGEACRTLIEPWTWERAARQVCEVAFSSP